jgi:hypothetical protein
MDASPPLENFVEKADRLVASDEQYPISLLQRKFKIGYFRAQRLLQLVQEKRSRSKPDYRSVLQAAWAKAMHLYEQGKVNSECTLHSYLYGQLLSGLPECTILCEPQLNLNRHGIFVPDIVVVKDDQIMVVMEIKFVPHGYPVFEMDMAKMRAIGIDESDTDHDLLLDPSTGLLQSKKSRISKQCLLCFAVVGRSDAKAVDPDDLKEALVSGGRTDLLDRFLPLVRTTNAPPLSD